MATQTVPVEQSKPYINDGASNMPSIAPAASQPLTVPLSSSQQKLAYGHSPAMMDGSGGSATGMSGLMTNTRMMMYTPATQPQLHQQMMTQQPSVQLIPQQQQLQQLLNEPLSEVKTILKAELGGGLSVTLRYRYAAVAVSFAGAHCAYLTVQNHSDHSIR